MQTKLEIFEFKAPEHDKTRNFGYRPEGEIIDTIIIHYTAGDFLSSYKQLTMPRNVSAHYLIDIDGTTFQLVADDKVAWHAGASSWLSKDNVNNFSIGIELINSGSEQKIESGTLIYGEKDYFPQPQMTALSQLTDYLKHTHNNITDRNIIGHSDITAYNCRKIDPGITFNWKEFSIKGHGLYPQCDTSLIKPQILYSYGNDYNYESIKNLQGKLSQYGYKIEITGIFDENTNNVVRAFNMHFHNDITFEYECWDNISEILLNDLLTQI